MWLNAHVKVKGLWDGPEIPENRNVRDGPGEGERRAVVRKQIGAIARTAFLESIQQPIVFLLQLASAVMTLLVPIFQFHRFSEDGRLARDSGLSCMLVFGMALAVGTAGRSVAGEIANGTAASVLGKPVGRTLFVFSKWLGCVYVVALFCLGQLAALMVSERASAHFVMREDFSGYATDPISLTLALGGLVLVLAVAAGLHFARRQRFGVSVFVGIVLSQVAVCALSGFYNRLGDWYPIHGEAACTGLNHAHAHAEGATHLLFYHPELNLRVIPVAILVFLVLLIFAALATALSTRIQTGGVMTVCTGVLLLGLSGDTFLSGERFVLVKRLVSGVLPDLQNFWLCDAIAHGGHVAAGYVVAAAGYALTCCLLFLLLGSLAFRGRDLG